MNEKCVLIILIILFTLIFLTILLPDSIYNNSLDENFNNCIIRVCKDEFDLKYNVCVENENTQITSVLNSPSCLSNGKNITSPNRYYKLKMQTDNNLIIYDKDNKTIWETETSSSSDENKLCIHEDGNMVIYNKDNKVKWKSDTDGIKGNYKLQIENDGNLVIYDKSNDKKMWSIYGTYKGSNYFLHTIQRKRDNWYLCNDGVQSTHPRLEDLYYSTNKNKGKIWMFIPVEKNNDKQYYKIISSKTTYALQGINTDAKAEIDNDSEIQKWLIYKENENTYIMNKNSTRVLDAYEQTTHLSTFKNNHDYQMWIISKLDSIIKSS